MLLTNNYYHITNKVYKFISDERIYLRRTFTRCIKASCDWNQSKTNSQNALFLLSGISYVFQIRLSHLSTHIIYTLLIDIPLIILDCFTNIKCVCVLSLAFSRKYMDYYFTMIPTYVYYTYVPPHARFTCFESRTVPSIAVKRQMHGSFELFEKKNNVSHWFTQRARWNYNYIYGETSQLLSRDTSSDDL